MKRNTFLLCTAIGSFALVAGIPLMRLGASDINFAAQTNEQYSLVFSSKNQIDGSGKILTNLGNTVWAKGGSDTGVTWNNGNGKMAFAANGYVQTLSAIKGINKVQVELDSGALELFYDYKEPTNLETPMYEAGHVFTESGEFSFPENIKPTRIRIIATEASVVSKIALCYDCVTPQEDAHEETLGDYGFENSYIDAGSIGRYATTSFVVGEGNTCSRTSKRALKLSFKNTTNNYVSLNLQVDANKHLIDRNPDFTSVNVTFKAKFSSNISNTQLAIMAVGSSWADSGYQTMNRSVLADNGWYAYSCSFRNVNFSNNNSIIRLNIKPLGINASNKNSASVILDDISYHLEGQKTDLKLETPKDGMENLGHDEGWENTYYSYDTETTFGVSSKNSLCIRPGKGSFNGTKKWFTSFIMAPGDGGDDFYSAYYKTDFTSGVLDFVYKPVGISNPSTLFLEILGSWSDDKTATVNCTDAGNGWYRCHYNLAGLGLTTHDSIRVNLGFGASGDTGKVYIDNIKTLDSPNEPWNLGLESGALNDGMSKYSNNEYSYTMLASDTSYSSRKMTFKTTMPDTNGWQFKYPMIFDISSTLYTKGAGSTSGTFEGKFYFSNEFTERTIRLNIITDDWQTAKYDNLIPTSIGGGWYQLKVDLADLYQNWPSKNISSGFDPSKPMFQIGFGFNELTDSNAPGRYVYIDDVFYTPTAEASSSTAATVWQAYDTETVLKGASPISGRNITRANPLSFDDARNGTDSTQLMIKAIDNITSYDFKPGRLVSETGELFNPSSFETLVEKYVNVPATSAQKGKADYGWQGAGYYPDAGVPLDKIISANENYVTSGNEQGLWINCKIDKNQSAGTYEGNSILTLNGVDYLVPTKVKVYNATLSDQRHNKSMFLIWDDQISHELGKDGITMNSNLMNSYYRFLVDRGVGDHNRAWERGTPGMTTYDSFAENFANNVAPDPQITTYRMPFYYKTYEEMYGYFDALITKNIEQWDSGIHINFFEKTAVSLNDEPKAPVKLPADDSASKADWADVKTNQTTLNQVINDLKGRLASYPELKSSFENIRNVMAFNGSRESISGASYTYKESSWSIRTKTGYYPNYLSNDYIDTICPTFDYIASASDRDAYRSQFGQLWFYGCIVPTLPYPGYFVDVNLISQRSIKWMQYDYDIEGEVYWDTVHFQKKESDGEHDRDVWNDADTGASGYGDGQLTYPGTRYGIYGPITTLRLENIRNANEDYELFKMIDRNVAKINAHSGSSISSSRDLVGSYFSQMYTNAAVNKNFTSATFEIARSLLLSKLEYIY